MKDPYQRAAYEHCLYNTVSKRLRQETRQKASMASRKLVPEDGVDDSKAWPKIVTWWKGMRKILRLLKCLLLSHQATSLFSKELQKICPLLCPLPCRLKKKIKAALRACPLYKPLFILPLPPPLCLLLEYRPLEDKHTSFRNKNVDKTSMKDLRICENWSPLAVMLLTAKQSSCVKVHFYFTHFKLSIICNSCKLNISSCREA